MADPTLEELLYEREDPDGKFWAHVRASIAEGFCPTPGCGGRLAPDRVVAAAGGIGGRCPVHGIRYLAGL